MPRWSNSFYDRGGGGRGRPGSRGGGGTREAFSNVFSAGCFSMAKQPDTYIDFKHRPAENPRQRAVSRFLQTGDKVNRLKSSYAKKKSGHNNSRRCKFCGGPWHESREAECKAYDATCNACGKKGHFKIVCRSKKLTTLEASKEETKSESGDCLYEGLMNIHTTEQTSATELHVLSAISTGDLVYDKRSKRWVQRSLRNEKIHKMGLHLKVCKDSLTEFKQRSNQRGVNDMSEAFIDGVADTGCSIMCAGVQACHMLNFPVVNLLQSDVTLKVADGRELTVMGAVPVDVSIRNMPGHTSKQLLHIVSELKTLFVSKSCLMDLGVISPNFPMPPLQQEKIDILEEDLQGRAPCGCLTRALPPDPPELPCEPTEENIPKLKQFIIDHYSSSTMNMCTHQQLPVMTGPPLHFTLKPDAKSVAVHKPAVVPIHWVAPVREQLMRDVELGILERVQANEPTVWQHRMVVVRKPNGTPRRTVDMQSLNKATLRNSHPMTSPYIKAMSVPANTFKTVTDAWEGYHAVPLDEESSKMTQFITQQVHYAGFQIQKGPSGLSSIWGCL